MGGITIKLMNKTSKSPSEASWQVPAVVWYLRLSCVHGDEAALHRASICIPACLELSRDEISCTCWFASGCVPARACLLFVPWWLHWRTIDKTQSLECEVVRRRSESHLNKIDWFEREHLAHITQHHHHRHHVCIPKLWHQVIPVSLGLSA